MPETDEHVVAVVALLRQLWLGLSAYRLYPGSVTRPGFVSAVERIGTVAARALADGPVDVEIRGDRFSMDGELLPSDDSGERLALACFERGVERVVVREVPTAEDLGDLYGILSTPPSELAAQGEAGLSLLAAGVTSITLSEVGPAPVEGADHAPEEMAERLVPDAAMLASQLMLEDLPGSPRDQAETLMNRLRALLARGVGEGIAPIDVHSAVHDALDDLPPELRRTVIDLAIEHLGDDPAAQRLIGTMSDTELTRALVDLGRGGHRDPEELARMLADSGARHVDLVDLTVALEAGWEEAGTIIAGLEQLGIDLSQQRAATLAAGSATEALSDYLSATEADDVRSMRAGMTAGASDRTNALLALRDYLTLESDLERVGEVLDVWAEELRDAIRERDQRRRDLERRSCRHELGLEPGVCRGERRRQRNEPRRG